MSVNITVSGKFAKQYTHPLLVDPQDAKKSEEKERRKLRLLQVREQSKKIAKKIRDKVNEEKKRELQKLQDIKAKEMECWRQHVLQRKNEEYCAAIFQVGTAHEAARTENQEKCAKQKQPQGSYKDFKKQIMSKKCRAEKVKFSCLPSCSCQLPQTSANKHGVCTCAKAQTRSEEEAQKRKRDLSFSTSDSDCEDEGYKEQTNLHQSSISLSSSCDSTMLSCGEDLASKKSVFVPTKNKCLIKTPSVFLDVQVGSDDSVTINAPAEVKDTHCKYNRQFSSVIRISPRKERNKKQNTVENSTTQQSSTITVLSSDTTGKDDDKNKNVLEKSQSSQSSAVQVSKEKRFTIISELVKKQQNTETVQSRDLNPSNSHTTAATATKHLSPKKQLREAAVRPPIMAPTAQSPRKVSATSKSSRTVSNQPLSSLTTTTKNNSAGITSSCSGRVQFYDYNTKLAKEQDQSAKAVLIQRQQRDQAQPSAMQQAEFENLKERERQLEELKRQQQMQERGQKALEREQIRRDCKELTEKLEILSQEYAKQLPTNDNQLHYFADKQLRKEDKMNTAVEKLLQRPSIITCPEPTKSLCADLKQTTTTTTTASRLNEDNRGNILNVASLNNKPLSLDDVSSDSCCSILLGYVNDQSKRIKQDIQRTDNSQNQSKQKRLKELLKRLDNLRNSLLEELKTESKLSGKSCEKDKANVGTKESNLKQVIDSISELRKQHEEIIINERDKNPKSLREREKLLKAKEEILERKVREFFELQNQTKDDRDCQVNDNLKRATDKEKTKVCVAGENPLEILITVNGDTTKCVKVPAQTRRKMCLKRAGSKITTTLTKSPQPTLSRVIKHTHTPKKKLQNAKQLSANQGILRRQNSYDSNSTSYMSLPPQMPTKINDLAQAIAKQANVEANKTTNVKETTLKPTTGGHNQQQNSDSSQESLLAVQPPRINPLIAQYVQRLLGMSRCAVQKLGVSSSDIATPNSSIIHTPDNIASSQNIISEDRLKALQNFIEENKSFIEDVELSMRSQNNVSLENSLKKLDDLWRKRLKNEQKAVKQNEGNLKKIQEKHAKQKSNLSEKTNISEGNKMQPPAKSLTSKSKSNESKPTLNKDNLFKDLSKSVSSRCSSEDKETSKVVKTKERSNETVVDSNKVESDAQIARYAKLTKNCTHRIAELTELINRVREEKQRLLEVTLSSVSDNGRHSTEYLELAEGKTSTRTEQDDLTRVSSSSEEITQNKQTTSSNALAEMAKLTTADKNKQLTKSCDSGIADSRPVTSLENRCDPEPLSLTSSESALLPPAIRKMKPPPTLRRYSPQLPEEELAHELSTIFEVDTPATSRINTAIGQSAGEREMGSSAATQQPIQFPTFEQYIEKLNLDITQLNTEQSLQLQQEFTAFLETLQRSRLTAESPKYSKFPSIASYIQQLAECDILAGETLEESLAKLHISGITANNFPPVREYIRHNESKTPKTDTQQLLDTESLENITDVATQTNTDNDTASVDIQEELKKRKIIKKPFRVSETKRKEIFTSTAHKDHEHNPDILVAESGIDKLSTSVNTSDLLDNDLKDMVKRWSRELKIKSKEVNVLSSTTTSINISSLTNSTLRTDNANEDCKKKLGRAFNLRDFLIRELEKNAISSDSPTNSSADDSLRNHFLHSLLGSLTPCTPGVASKSGGQTLDRQKTSTPVLPQSSRIHSSASSHSSSSSIQLFSGESRLSSVHYQNRTEEHLITNADNNTDQSSE